MKKFFLVLWAFCALICGAKEVIVSNGQSLWSISLSPRATATELNAANELQRAVKLMTGCELAIGRWAVAPEKSIVIGIEEMSGVPAGQDALHVYSKDGRIYCMGNNPRGALYAVYAFLEKAAGIRWVWPGASGEIIPKRSVWEIEALDFRETSRFEYRGFHVCGSFYNEEMELFMSRNRLNIMRSNPVNGRQWVKEWNDKRIARGMRIMFSNHNIAIYDRKVFEERPELFALVNGQRVRDQLCWSNPEVDQIMIDQFVRYCNEYPDVEILSLFPADNMNYCRCEKCSAKPRTDLWFEMFNRLSAGIRAKCPWVKVASLAYQSYLQVPSAPLDGTEFIEYCMYNRCYVHALDKCPVNARMLQSLETWRQKGVPLLVYGYEFDIFTPPMFMPFASMLQNQMQNFAALGIRGVITEVSPPGYRNPNGAQSPSGLNPGVHHRLGHYIYARLLWNPDIPVETLLTEVSEAAFDIAAGEMKQYYMAMDNAWSSMSIHYSYFFNSPLAGAASLLNDALIARCDKLFADALAKAARITDPARKQQVLANLNTEKRLYEAWKRCAQDYQASQNGSKILLPRTGNRDNAIRLPAFVAKQGKPAAQTEVTMRYDAENIYIEAICHDPDISKLVRGPAEHDGALWTGEALELFFAVPGDTEGIYRHMIVNPNGARYESIALGGMTFNTAWNPQWQVQCEIGNDYWSASIVIPFAAFGKVPQDNEVWGFTIKRSNGDSRKELPNSGFPDAAFHDRNSFGLIQFCPQERIARTLFFSKHKVEDVREMAMLLGNAGFQTVTVRDEKQLTASFPEQDIYIIRHYRGIRINPEFFRQAVLPRLENGALVLFASWGELPLADYFGRPELAVKWSGWQIDPARKSIAVKPGAWQNTPDNISHILRTSLTPANGYLPENPAGWENYGSLKMKDGSLYSFLLVRKVGRGLLVLTSADFGMSGGGAMFGSRKHQSVSLLRNFWYLNTHSGR